MDLHKSTDSLIIGDVQDIQGIQNTTNVAYAMWGNNVGQDDNLKGNIKTSLNKINDQFTNKTNKMNNVLEQNLNKMHDGLNKEIKDKYTGLLSNLENKYSGLVNKIENRYVGLEHKYTGLINKLDNLPKLANNRMSQKLVKNNKKNTCNSSINPGIIIGLFLMCVIIYYRIKS